MILRGRQSGELMCVEMVVVAVESSFFILGAEGIKGIYNTIFVRGCFCLVGIVIMLSRGHYQGVWSNLVFLGNVRADFPLAALVYMKLVNMGIWCRVVPCFSLWAKLSCN